MVFILSPNGGESCLSFTFRQFWFIEIRNWVAIKMAGGTEIKHN